MSNLQIFVRLWKEYTESMKYKILLAIFYSLIVAGSTASIAWLLDPAIEKLFVERDQSLLIIIPALIILAFSMKGTFLYLSKTTMITVGENLKATITADMAKTLIIADSDYIDEKHTGKFISNLTFDTGLISNLISTTVLNLFKDSFTLISLLTVMFLQNWKLSLVAIIMIPLAAIASKSLGKRIGKVSTEAQEQSGHLVTHLIEVFKNHKLIKIFQKEKNEQKRVNTFINGLRDKSKKISFIFVRATPIMETLTGIMIAILIWYSGLLMVAGELKINNFFSFLAAMMLAYQPVRSLATVSMGANQGLSAAKRIFPILDIQNEISEKENSTELKVSKGDITFKNVTFKYKTSSGEILKSINLNIMGGKMNALVGQSGAGKSTVLNLIPRFFNCTDGEILIDNQSINNVSVDSLRKNISLVSQDTTLFDDTIKNNIAYANSAATNDEIINASKEALAHDFIEKLPEQYNTQIGEDGVRISGGEKQRLSIARAILKKTPIILLDEATSSLDADTEHKIQKGLNYLTKDKTTLVIAHRLSTILNSEKIFVLEDGELVAEGKHEELLNSSSIYKNFYDKQIKKD